MPRIELTVLRNDAEDMVERTYSYAVEFSDRTPLETIEAHAANMFKILDRQAHEGLDEDDEDWKRPDSPSSAP